MAYQWNPIGIQLRQSDLVDEFTDVRAPLGSQKVQRIISAWLKSDIKDVPVCAATMTKVLRSDAVRLNAVATELEKVRWPL